MHLIIQILTTARALERAGQRIFKQHQLSSAQFNVLNLLSDQPEGMRATQLAEALVVDPSNITGLLKRMNAAGLLKELENPNDARERVVALSPKGHRLWQKANVDYQRELDRLGDLVSAKERGVTDTVLNTLAEAVRSHEN
jgi:DNA-binding MarR family transcriptional regulator